MPNHAPPTVSLVLAVRNEDAHIARAVQSCLDQDYPADRLEVIVADGDSTDRTVVAVKAIDPDRRVKVIRNADRLMPYGLNLALAAAKGDYIGLVSGHGAIPSDYVARCVHALERTGAWAVGGRVVRRTSGDMQRAIAAVTSHPLGVGDARHNYATRAGWAEAAYPGFWRREVFERVGPFDPTMVVNEDNELSLRILRAGGRIWYEPKIGVEYVPRDSLTGLFCQYRRYGMGKVAVFRKHRAGVSWRHLVPSAWLAYIVGGGVATLTTRSFVAPWIGGAAVYFGATAAVAFRLRHRASWWRIAAAFVTIHTAYGIGFVQGCSSWFRMLVLRRG